MLPKPHGGVKTEGIKTEGDTKPGEWVEPSECERGTSKMYRNEEVGWSITAKILRALWDTCTKQGDINGGIGLTQL